MVADFELLKSDTVFATSLYCGAYMKESDRIVEVSKVTVIL